MKEAGSVYHHLLESDVNFTGTLSDQASFNIDRQSLMTVASPSNHKNAPGVWVTVTKHVWIDSQTVMGDDARIEARGSKNDARASRFYSRVSIRASTTTNVIFNLTIRASLPLLLNGTLNYTDF